MQKLLTFFSKHISVQAVFNDQSFNDTLTNDIISFEQLGPEWIYYFLRKWSFTVYMYYLQSRQILRDVKPHFLGKIRIMKCLMQSVLWTRSEEFFEKVYKLKKKKNNNKQTFIWNNQTGKLEKIWDYEICWFQECKCLPSCCITWLHAVYISEW